MVSYGKVQRPYTVARQWVPKTLAIGKIIYARLRISTLLALGTKIEGFNNIFKRVL